MSPIVFASAMMQRSAGHATDLLAQGQQLWHRVVGELPHLQPMCRGSGHV